MKKYYIDFFTFDGKYKNTAVAKITEQAYDHLLKYKDVQVNKIGLGGMNPFVYFSLFRPLTSLFGRIMLLKNPDSLIVPMHCDVFFHDTIPYDNAKGWRKVYFYLQYKIWLACCRRVFTFSNNVKQRLVAIYGSEAIADKIVIVPTFIDRTYIEYDVNIAKQVTQNKGQNYILGFGTGEPRKNITRTLELFQSALAIDNTIRLVLFGNDWNRTGYKLVEEEIARFGLQEKVKHVGKISAIELADLYAGCRCFLFPSITEGVGLPPIEALACGATVILSDIPIFRELFGDYRNVFFVSLKNEGQDDECIRKTFSHNKDLLDCVCTKQMTVENMVDILHNYMDNEKTDNFEG